MRWHLRPVIYACERIFVMVANKQYEPVQGTGEGLRRTIGYLGRTKSGIRRCGWQGSIRKITPNSFK